MARQNLDLNEFGTTWGMHQVAECARKCFYVFQISLITAASPHFIEKYGSNRFTGFKDALKNKTDIRIIYQGYIIDAIAPQGGMILISPDSVSIISYIRVKGRQKDPSHWTVIVAVGTPFKEALKRLRVKPPIMENILVNDPA
jgi:hypothetical protein